MGSEDTGSWLRSSFCKDLVSHDPDDLMSSSISCSHTDDLKGNKLDFLDLATPARAPLAPRFLSGYFDTTSWYAKTLSGGSFA